MKTRISLLLCFLALLALALVSCNSNSLKQNKIYVTGTSVMGESTLDKDLFQSFNQFPQSDSADFPKTKVIQMPDGSSEEGEKTNLSLPGRGYLPTAVYKLKLKDYYVTVTEDETVLGIDKFEPVLEFGTAEPVMSEEDYINKAKEHYLSFFGKDVPDGCKASFFWDNNEQGRKCRANVCFNKESEGYKWYSGISIGMTVSGELLKISDRIQLLSEKSIPSGFAKDIEKRIENWIKDKTTDYTLSQKTLLLSNDGTLIARTFVEVNPADGEPFGITVIIPLD